MTPQISNSDSNSSNNNTINNSISRGAADDLETFAMENCLMLLATKAAAAAEAEAATAKKSATSSGGEVDDAVMGKYPCTTCGKKYMSFQALGGHRASHVRPKLTVNNGTNDASDKPKTFKCSICGDGFPTGQALGGHMRRHRNREDSNGKKEIKKRKKDDVITPLLKKLSSSGHKRVCLELNLDYAPLVAKKEQEDVDEIEEGEIVEDDNYDFLKLELRQPGVKF